jgi:exopolyphosphatase/guanosine-5'-triphosphate,3'-diphosphate pyrophosphatase
MTRKKRSAAIDVGSHEIRLYIAETANQAAPVVVETVRRTLPIGTDTYMTGSISPELVHECVDILTGFAAKIREYKIHDVVAVATSAFREAANCYPVLDQINRETGISIRVLSNAEEKYYHTLALAELLPNFTELIRQGTLIVDIGSGSVQATAYDKGDFIFSQNMLLGSLRLRELLADLQRLTSDYAALLEEYISSDLENYRMLEPKNMSYENLIVLCGDLAYLKRMAASLLTTSGGDRTFMTHQSFELVYQRLLSDQPRGLTIDYDIPAENATLLLPTAMIMRKFLQFTGAKGFYVPSASLCDGLLTELSAKQHGYEPIYDQSRDLLSACRQIANRFRTDRKHTDWVEKATLAIFDDTMKLHRLGERHRLLLQLAAILHDCGKYINMSQHSVRSYNIIMSIELIGLSHQEREVVAFTARFHSEAKIDEDLQGHRLTEEEKLLIAKLSAILRLADALDTGHKQKIADLELQIDDDYLTLTVSTAKDIMLEQWSVERKGRLFKDVYGLTPRVRVRKLKP